MQEGRKATDLRPSFFVQICLKKKGSERNMEAESGTGDVTDAARYYVTTAIDYPNAAPHIGHALEKVAADVVARYHRLQGHDTYFSMGVDENSQHVLRAAEAHGVDPRTWVDNINAAFQLAWSKLDISYDD